jgi:RNA recognition motif-containing protein
VRKPVDRTILTARLARLTNLPRATYLAATTEDTTAHHCLFVGNIGNEVDDHALFEFFAGLYPSCSSARIARDGKGSGDGRHAGYGFVTFREKSDADKAVQNTGTQLGSRSLRIMVAKSQTVSAGCVASRRRWRRQQPFRLQPILLM